MGSGHIHHMPEGSITVLPRWRDWRSTQQSCVIWKAENQGRFCEQFLDQYVQYKVKRSLVSTESLEKKQVRTRRGFKTDMPVSICLSVVAEKHSSGLNSWILCVFSSENQMEQNSVSYTIFFERKLCLFGCNIRANK